MVLKIMLFAITAHFLISCTSSTREEMLLKDLEKLCAKFEEPQRSTCMYEGTGVFTNEMPENEDFEDQLKSVHERKEVIRDKQ